MVIYRFGKKIEASISGSAGVYAAQSAPLHLAGFGRSDGPAGKKEIRGKIGVIQAFLLVIKSVGSLYAVDSFFGALHMTSTYPAGSCLSKDNPLETLVIQPRGIFLFFIQIVLGHL